MDIYMSNIRDVWIVAPRQHSDSRGKLLEWYRFDRLTEVVGRPLRLAQANISISARGTTRGIHFADVPPGQAKYVTCDHGAVIDVIVDLRVGSPTFGQHEAIRLDEESRKALYISEGIGHGFCALTDDASLVYLFSENFAPEREHGVFPFDPALGIEWPVDEAVLSEKDATAPTLATAQERGLLPDWHICQEYYAQLGGRNSI